ncbi:hypothetical protein H0B42_12495 [Rhodococcus aetherivorans]|uniref:hypothetical protein n=1 Tax=Rhodococcus aetherivorans TaxID=191292 RepID=UPI00029A212A|nr:hypothetical protein [Rhodococcus aetherivorans]
MIVDYIDAHRSRVGVDPICAVLTEYGISIASSTYKAKDRRRVSAAGRCGCPEPDRGANHKDMSPRKW